LELVIDARRQVGTTECQEADRIRKCLLCEASEKLRGQLREASDGRRSQHGKREIALRDDQRHYVVDRGDRSHGRRRIDDDRGGNDRRHSYGASKRRFFLAGVWPDVSL
jgi:hypothetical protein